MYAIYETICIEPSITPTACQCDFYSDFTYAHSLQCTQREALKFNVQTVKKHVYNMLEQTGHVGRALMTC